MVCLGKDTVANSAEQNKSSKATSGTMVHSVMNKRSNALRGVFKWIHEFIFHLFKINFGVVTLCLLLANETIQ
jgi:hypothetical protein